MDCEQAFTLLCADIDGSIDDDERVALDAHLAECQACRQAGAGLRTQDADLRRAFAPHRAAASAVADRVTNELLKADAPSRSGRRWPAMFTSAAAGFFIALLAFQPWRVTEPAPRSAPVGRFSVGHEPLEILTPHEQTWTKLFRCGTIEPGSRIRTGPNQVCEFVLSDGTELRLNRGTAVEILDSRRVHLEQGELWGSVTAAAAPLEILTADRAIRARDAHFDVAADSARCVVTVAEGHVTVMADGVEETVTPCQVLTIEGDRRVESVPVKDLVTATRWLHPILIAKGRKSPELSRRVAYLFARLATTESPEVYEQEIRALGSHAVIPLASLLTSLDPTTESAARRRAAWMIAELAEPAQIPTLLELLDDEVAEVRVGLDRGLVRLTGYAHDPDAQSPLPGAALASARHPQDWWAWWDENKHLFPASETTSRTRPPYVTPETGALIAPLDYCEQ